MWKFWNKKDGSEELLLRDFKKRLDSHIRLLKKVRYDIPKDFYKNFKKAKIVDELLIRDLIEFHRLNFHNERPKQHHDKLIDEIRSLEDFRKQLSKRGIDREKGEKFLSLMDMLILHLEGIRLPNFREISRILEQEYGVKNPSILLIKDFWNIIDDLKIDFQRYPIEYRPWFLNAINYMLATGLLDKINSSVYYNLSHFFSNPHALNEIINMHKKGLIRAREFAIMTQEIERMGMPYERLGEHYSDEKVKKILELILIFIKNNAISQIDFYLRIVRNLHIQDWQAKDVLSGINSALVDGSITIGDLPLLHKYLGPALALLMQHDSISIFNENNIKSLCIVIARFGRINACMERIFSILDSAKYFHDAKQVLDALSMLNNHYISQDGNKLLDVLRLFEPRYHTVGLFSSIPPKKGMEMLNQVTPAEMADKDIWELILLFAEHSRDVDRIIQFAVLSYIYGETNGDRYHYHYAPAIENQVKILINDSGSYINFIRKYGKRLADIRRYFEEIGITNYTNKIVGENFLNIMLDSRVINRLKFEKTGSGLIPLGGKFKTQMMVRIIPETAYLAWKKAQDEGIPVEGIVRAYRAKNGMIRVYCMYEGEQADIYAENHPELKGEIERQKERIASGLRRLRIEHEHLEDRNFTVKEENGRVIVTAIDFDRAHFY